MNEYRSWSKWRKSKMSYEGCFLEGRPCAMWSEDILQHELINCTFPGCFTHLFSIFFVTIRFMAAVAHRFRFAMYSATFFVLFTVFVFYCFFSFSYTDKRNWTKTIRFAREASSMATAWKQLKYFLHVKKDRKVCKMHCVFKYVLLNSKWK